ncbi:hypothetical protein DSM03_108134 [Leeuwenhoekiella aestuarii]|uniref:Serine aminopeptidase S33 domain-containing protein n=1 Tax=Leeuwenhoekiella aestuarii TaxID=2249426 RepID=A0A4Q0NQW8_9FLAO|nr:alpha/beta hydrolase [Leeuwenhoekiella aestuarii]RXG12988.1 hypothetical protein DSM03_108134 [Leeuwenhoekiella aestuarii]RXG13032.1 hypothetical protein DSM04_1059 [Leeuwenhoekiella aestuarii]
MRIAVLLCFVLFNVTLHSQNLLESNLRVNNLIAGTLLEKNSESDTLAIIIADSGPTDRNGNQRNVQNNSLKFLAEKITEEGISTFRYDKRLIPLIRQNTLQEERLRFDDLVNDAVAVISFFKDKYSSIILIGHAQGSLIAMLAAQKIEVTKIISIAGMGESIDQLIIGQLELQAPGLVDNAKQAFKDLKETGKSKNYSQGLVTIFRPSVQPFMKSWINYDPSEIITELDLPILLIQGTKNLQIPQEQAEILKSAKPEAQLILIKDMNHVLKQIEGDDLENSKSYNEPYRPVSSELIKNIISFIDE